MENGKKMYEFASRIYPICRSITGNGVRNTLAIIKEYIPELSVFEVPSGTQVFDWTIPKEWNIENAYIEDSGGNKVLDFEQHNLHVVGYSYPMNEYMNLRELKNIVYTQPDQPDVIPYVTSYYKERSGFCMSQNKLDSLKEDRYHCVIDSEVKEGFLSYGEVLIPGKTQKEVLFSTYICHPSMANNECSGPALAVELINWIKKLKERKFTYRFIFVPETIGAITYLSKNYRDLKKNVYAGFNLSCVGDNRNYSFVATRYGKTVTDRVLRNILYHHTESYKEYSFLQRGSDERQYNAPGIDLPVCGFSRTKYGEYPEYHTSADDMSVISPEGFSGSFDIMKKCIIVLEKNEYYRVQTLCEPQLGKRGLYPTISQKGSYDAIFNMTNFIAYADGNNDLLEIAEILAVDAMELVQVVDKLLTNGLIKYEEK